MGTSGNSIAPYTRGGLIESIATAAALAQTANTDVEYMHWDNRRTELEKKAGAISDQEMDTIVKIARTKMEAYGATV